MKPLFRRASSTDSFTLIELLVVASIVTLLAALLLPMLSRAISQARQAKCASNLRQIGMAFESFATDNNGAIPWNVDNVVNSAIYVGQSTTPSATWSGALLPYLYPDATIQTGHRPNGVFACPESKAVILQYAGDSDYGKNFYINTQPPAFSSQNWGRPQFSLISMSSRGKVIAVGDCPPRSGTSYCGRELGPTYAAGNLMTRHGGMTNVLYYDWHVEALNPTNLPLVAKAPPWSPLE